MDGNSVVLYVKPIEEDISELRELYYKMKANYRLLKDASDNKANDHGGVIISKLSSHYLLSAVNYNNLYKQYELNYVGSVTYEYNVFPHINFDLNRFEVEVGEGVEYKIGSKLLEAGFTKVDDD